jgi:hypothetical protein
MHAGGGQQLAGVAWSGSAWRACRPACGYRQRKKIKQKCSMGAEQKAGISWSGGGHGYSGWWEGGAGVGGLSCNRPQPPCTVIIASGVQHKHHVHAGGGQQLAGVARSGSAWSACQPACGYRQKEQHGCRAKGRAAAGKEGGAQL